MEIVNTQTFETQSGSLGTRYNLKNKAKNILIKLSDVNISKIEPNAEHLGAKQTNKVVIRIPEGESLNTLVQFEEKVTNFIVEHFKTSNEYVSQIIYCSEAGNCSTYVRLNNYTSIYDIEGDNYELNDEIKVIGDVILKFDTITYINNKYHVNASLYQCLVKEEAENYNTKKLLLSNVEFLSNF